MRLKTWKVLKMLCSVKGEGGSLALQRSVVIAPSSGFQWEHQHIMITVHKSNKALKCLLNKKTPPSYYSLHSLQSFTFSLFSLSSPYVEPMVKPPFDDVDPEYGLHGYQLHIVLHNTECEIMCRSFSQLFCRKSNLFILIFWLQSSCLSHLW